MPPVLSQSQINSATDQIYLDTSDTGRLSAVGASLGLPRPSLGLADDAEFRAMVRRIAQKRKLTKEAFHRLMETCLGPQYARRSALREAASAGDMFLEVEDASVFTPAGTVRLNAGQTTEDTVRYVFRDIKNNRLTLNRALTFDHPIIADAETRLRQTALAGATSVLLEDTSTFPTAGYPYPVLLSQGHEREESALVTGNNTVTNTLTLLAATANDHYGTTLRPVTAKVLKLAYVGQYFITVAGDTTALENFPPSGWICIDKGLITEEVIRYTRLDPLTSTIYFNTPLSKAHAPTAEIDLAEPGEGAATAGVLQDGVHWEIYETQPNRVVLYVPAALRPLHLRDASWLHGAAISPSLTTLDKNYTTPELVVEVLDGSVLPSGGLYEIDGTEVFFAINLYPQYAGKLLLPIPLANNYLAGVNIVPVQPVYGGTDLLDGNPLDTGTGNWIPEQFPGHYVYNPLNAAPSIIQTALGEAICPPLEVRASSQVGWTCLEVSDAATWPAPPFAPFDVRIGFATGFEEVKSCVDVTRALTTTTTTVAPGAGFNNFGDVYLKGVATAAFPETGLAGRPAGYRVMVARGAANEEILTVYDNDTLNNKLYVPGGLQFTHLAGVSVELINDVLTFDAGFVYNHAGPAGGANPVPVERLYDKIVVADGTHLPTEPATVWLNFGNGRISARSRIVSVVGAVVTLADTSKFPATSYPYAVVLTEGGYDAETVFVTNNNTLLNELTLTGAPVKTHPAGDYAAFTAGEPMTVDYSSRAGNVLRFDTPVTFPTAYTEGESVIYSPGESEPNDDGTGYQFFLPPDPGLCLRSVLDLVRAAGVEVQVITER